MASAQGSAAAPRPSFATIARSGLKPPPSTQPKQSNNSIPSQKHVITSAPRDGTANVPSKTSQPTKVAVPAKKLVQIASPRAKEAEIPATPGPQVHVHGVDAKSPEAKDTATASGLLAPAASEDSITQLSSDSGSVKPASLDGKSVASVTTFAMDEKESLRPDDSASTKAAEDEDAFPPQSVSASGAAHRAINDCFPFGQQLREITSMKPAPRGMPTSTHGPPSTGPNGVLYMPPQGPGIGMVPSRAAPSADASLANVAPDEKLLEAIASPTERIHVLKIETDIADFINDTKENDLLLPQTNGYYRMLAHKAAEYYGLRHVYDETAESVRLFKAPTTCLRTPLIPSTAPPTASSTPPPSAPKMKILRRGEDAGPAIVNGSNIPSKSTSENGESGNEDDKRPKRPATHAEKVAQYEAARLRIMGSTQASDAYEDFKPKESSRSSSITGKKTKKKHCNDSDDDFDPRTSYSAYYTPPSYGSDGFTPTASYGFPYQQPGSGSMTPSSGFNSQAAPTAYQSYGAQGYNSMPWPSEGYMNQNAPQQWPGSQQGYDLSSDFQRNMSLQHQIVPQAPNASNGYNNGYQQQAYGTPSSWQQQQFPIGQQPTAQSNTNYSSNYAQRPASSQSQQIPNTPYQFGQLPSQTFGSRPPSKMEHPLPGSYRGKNFNPQSQTFVPGSSATTASFRPFSPQNPNPAAAGYPGGYGVGSPLNRQPSSQGQTTGYSSPRIPHGVSPQSHMPSQPMVHPLPQPVFPQQPSPNLPLPPKPGSTPQKPPLASGVPPTGSNGQTQSSIAKWGAPASLPAKPPPPAEPFDPAKFPQLQRQGSYNTAGTARMPVSGMPTFGQMPPMVSGYGANGMGGGRQ